MAQLTQSEQKRLVGTYAVNELVKEGLIFDGAKVGLGTGSTALPAVERLAHFIINGQLKDIKVVTTSFQTTIACENLGISVYSMNSKEIQGQLDIAIDGADEISPEKNLIKGGGAALLLEKIVAYNAKRFIVVADESKTVDSLGTKFPLPVEVIPEARFAVIRRLEELGALCTLREAVKKCGPVITDNGNIILDILWDNPVKPEILEDTIKSITGVVEVGFFTKNKPQVFVAHGDGSVTKIE